MYISEKGVEFISKWEGTKLEMYNCPAGHATIGTGHLIHYGKINGKESGIFKNGITKEFALSLLMNDLRKYVEAVERGLRVQLCQNQFDACIALCFNIGRAGFKFSTALRRMNKRDTLGRIEEAWKRWDKIKKGWQLVPCAGLTNRRAAEWELFQRGVYEKD